MEAARKGMQKLRQDFLTEFLALRLTFPVRGATNSQRRFQNSLVISIHAPREGSDISKVRYNLAFGISIHAPREGSDDAAHG